MAHLAERLWRGSEDEILTKPKKKMGPSAPLIQGFALCLSRSLGRSWTLSGLSGFPSLKPLKPLIPLLASIRKDAHFCWGFKPLVAMALRREDAPSPRRKGGFCCLSLQYPRFSFFTGDGQTVVSTCWNFVPFPTRFEKARPKARQTGQR